ncbi:dynamin family protein [Cellulomonas marina]|uniref:dynamin family protein n=2 Tax=Cellulomonas marina TaxID=988821 RepID=UPI001FD5A03C|nr:dynamin family protein [Cellulomonas marina]
MDTDEGGTRGGAPATAGPSPVPAVVPDDDGTGLAPDAPERMLARPLAATSLVEAVQDLLRDARRTSFPLDLPDVAAARGSRDRLVDQLAEHLLPRLRELTAPALVVVSGSTGAGKSTLVNSLVGREVSEAGVLRPTTRRPVLVHHPDDERLLAAHPVLEHVVVVADAACPRGIAVLDAPDLDSVLQSNRTVAHRLLEAADLWLFVTTASRYGDAVPWHVLDAAAARGTSVAVVLDRVAPASVAVVRADLLKRLRAHGLAGAPLFVVPDVGPHQGLLPPAYVAPIRRWLALLAGPDRARAVVARTLRGALSALRPWVAELADAVQAQVDAGQRLTVLLDEAVAPVLAAVRRSVAEGAVAQGGVRAGWAALVAPGAALDGVVSRGGRPRGRGRTARTRAAALAGLAEGVGSSATAVLVAAYEGGLDAARGALARSAEPGAAGLLADAPAPSHAPLGVPEAESAVGAWRAAVADRAVAALDQARRSAVERALGGAEAWAALLTVAAAGVADARRFAVVLAGPEDAAAVEGVVDASHADLAERAVARALAGRLDAGRVLRHPDLATDAASLLRLRLAVLKTFT